MANILRLREEIDRSGYKLEYILEKAEIPRHTFYRRLKNPDKFTQKEIAGLSNVLKLSNKTKDEIFLH